MALQRTVAKRCVWIVYKTACSNAQTAHAHGRWCSHLTEPLFRTILVDYFFPFASGGMVFMALVGRRGVIPFERVPRIEIVYVK